MNRFLNAAKADISIVIPVLNESDNVMPLVERIHSALDGLNVEVYFIDDSRNDLTTDKVNQAAENYGSEYFSVNVYHRLGKNKWGGLSGAVTDGFQRASSDNIVVMDGDLQHPPELIPEMIMRGEGSDIVATSRYCEGGNASGLNGSFRHIVSRASTYLAKISFPFRLKQITDPMTGFFHVDKTKVDLSRLRPKGWKILLEILITHPELSRTEVPLQFARREAGKSNGSIKQGFEFLAQLLTLRLAEIRESFCRMPKFIQFGVIGGSVFGVGMIILFALVEGFGWSPLAANAVQLAVTFWLNYRLNRRLTWRERNVSSTAAHKFLFSRGATTLLNYYLFALLISTNFSLAWAGTRYDISINYLLANIIALGIITLLNFVVSDKWAFANQSQGKSLANRILLSKFTFVILIIMLSFSMGFNTVLTISILLAIIGIVLFMQASIEVWRMLYAYREPDAVDRLKFPEAGSPKQSFCLLVPARHESEVLAETLKGLARQTHPSVHIVSVICDDDPDTLKVANRVAKNDQKVSVIEYPMQPSTKPSKPKQLNYAFDLLKNNGYSVFGIIDAEDTVNPELLMHVDAAFKDKEVGIVQGGVQLMNFESSWYSLHNVLEYYRWFNSAMSFQAANKFMPLGGNTIFVKTSLLEKTGGWPDTLTEDCSLGVLLSTKFQAKTAVYYDPKLATREETPDSLGGLFKQRVRWNQGFFHEWRKGVWKDLPSFRQRLLADYVLISPVLLAGISILMLVSLAAVFTLHAPVGLVMLMYLSIIPGILIVIANAIFLYDFGKAYNRKIRLKHYVILFVTSLPYQLVLNAAAFWSVVRELKGDSTWQKTEHSGLHRQEENYDYVFNPMPSAIELRGVKDG